MNDNGYIWEYANEHPENFTEYPLGGESTHVVARLAHLKPGEVGITKGVCGIEFQFRKVPRDPLVRAVVLARLEQSR